MHAKSVALKATTPGIQYLEVVGRRLEYSLLNPLHGSRPWIVFLHEGLGSIALWKDFPQHLCDAVNARGLVYSRYGYGRSTPLPAPYQRSVDFMHREAIDALPDLLTKLGIERPVLFGHSDGGSIALIHAATYPGSVTAVVALAPHVMVEDFGLRSIEKARLAYDTTDLRAKLGRYHDDVDSAFRGWNGIWLNPEFRTWNVEALLPLIECPVLAIQGVADEYGTMAQIDALARDIAQTRLLKLARCGHAPHKDQPQAVIDATHVFLSRLGEPV